MSKHQKDNTFEEDGIRPIESGDIEVADTFKEDGIRPIAKSPDYLVPNRTTENNDRDNPKSETPSTQKSDRPAKTSSNINSDLKVVDTFSEDGIRPIMANNYQIVDTLNVDGERPITSQQ